MKRRLVVVASSWHRAREVGEHRGLKPQEVMWPRDPQALGDCLAVGMPFAWDHTAERHPWSATMAGMIGAHLSLTRPPVHR